MNDSKFNMKENGSQVAKASLCPFCHNKVVDSFVKEENPQSDGVKELMHTIFTQ